MTDSSTEDPQALRARMKKLERLVYASLGLAGAAATLGVAAIAAVIVRTGALPAPATPSTIETSQLEIRDERGELRGRWGAQGFSLADETGRMRAGINLGPDGTPVFTFFSREGRIRTVIGLGGNDSTGLTLHDAQSRVRARLTVSGDDSILELTNAKGDIVGRLPSLPPPAKPKSRPKR